MAASNHETAPKFLIIRRDNIGDLVCTTPLFHALRNRFPDSRICALVNSYNSPVLENNPDINALYAYTKGKHRPRGKSLIGVYWNRIRLISRLRREHFDYVILAGPRLSSHALRLARPLKPRHIVGFIEPGKREARYVDIGVPNASPKPLHEVEDVFRLLAPLGVEENPSRLRIFPDPEQIKTVQRKIQEQNGTSHTNLTGIHISARKSSNQWPVRNFIDLITRLHKTRDTAFMLLWSPGDAANPLHPGDDAKAEIIVESLKNIPVIAYPTTHLGQLIAALSLCRTLICSDGGAMHIAAALGKPVLCFFGNSDRTRWYPWGVPHVLLQPQSLNVADIRVDEALAGFERLQVLSKNWEEKSRASSAGG